MRLLDSESNPAVSWWGKSRGHSGMESQRSQQIREFTSLKKGIVRVFYMYFTCTSHILHTYSTCKIQSWLGKVYFCYSLISMFFFLVSVAYKRFLFVGYRNEKKKKLESIEIRESLPPIYTGCALSVFCLAIHTGCPHHIFLGSLAFPTTEVACSETGFYHHQTQIDGPFCVATGRVARGRQLEEQSALLSNWNRKRAQGRASADHQKDVLLPPLYTHGGALAPEQAVRLSGAHSDWQMEVLLGSNGEEEITLKGLSSEFHGHVFFLFFSFPALMSCIKKKKNNPQDPHPHFPEF